MKWLKWLWIPTLILFVATLCFAADFFFEGYDGTPGAHVAGWWDNTNPGPSVAADAEFIYSTTPSLGEVVTVTGSQGYGEVYKDFITVDAKTQYKYLQIKVDTISNTATTWTLGICTFQPDTWLGNMSYMPVSEPNTATGFYSFDISSAFDRLDPPEHFVISLVVSGVQVDTGETNEWGDPIYDYYGYDGDKVGIDYIRLSDTDGVQATPTPGGTPVATPTPYVVPTPVRRGFKFSPAPANNPSGSWWIF